MIVYLDCVGGLAGDMLLAALLDAGAPEAELRAVPERLGLHGVELAVTSVERHGIRALHVDVTSLGAEHPHRSWRSIREQLIASDLAEPVRDRSIAVFTRLAEAEGRIHGVPADEVHFHELGAVDTLVDIVGAVTLLRELRTTRVVCSPLPVGRGLIRTAHGMLPLPAPATAALLEGARIVGVELDAELVTPTGAALASTLADTWGVIPNMTLSSTGYGAGTADFEQRANVVRVLVGEQVGEQAGVGPAPTGEAVLLETNIDDLIPELVPDAMDSCFAAGALDVWVTPVTMKKGRPGLVLSALVRPHANADVARAMLEQTSALGVRMTPLQRYELRREHRTVEVDGQQIRIKLGFLDERIVNIAPEHDDCAAAAKLTGTPVKSVWAAALAAGRDLR